ncbi:hypothetical protein BVRB_1g019940 [Beta vulgaris subsp. vulgaris]|nr:hypothetical protein BVRB_1g019940 [Beta vulgaris subsp. vulgaris]
MRSSECCNRKRTISIQHFGNHSRTSPKNHYFLFPWVTKLTNSTKTSATLNLAKNTTMENKMVTDVHQLQQSQQLNDLIQSLEQATLMAKQLPAISDSDQHRLILSSLSSAQLSLSSFLTLHINNNYADNSVSCADVSDDDPMVAVDDEDDDEEQISKDSSMERVEEKMRDSLSIQNKRPKRPLSPSSVSALERRRIEERESVRVSPDFDPLGNRSRKIDLVFQFHG